MPLRRPLQPQRRTPRHSSRPAPHLPQLPQKVACSTPLLPLSVLFKVTSAGPQCAPTPKTQRHQNELHFCRGSKRRTPASKEAKTEKKARERPENACTARQRRVQGTCSRRRRVGCRNLRLGLLPTRYPWPSVLFTARTRPLMMIVPHHLRLHHPSTATSKPKPLEDIQTHLRRCSLATGPSPPIFATLSNDLQSVGGKQSLRASIHGAMTRNSPCHHQPSTQQHKTLPHKHIHKDQQLHHFHHHPYPRKPPHCFLINNTSKLPDARYAAVL